MNEKKLTEKELRVVETLVMLVQRVQTKDSSISQVTDLQKFTKFNLAIDCANELKEEGLISDDECRELVAICIYAPNK